MLDTTCVTPEVAAEMLGTSVEMLLLAGAEGRIEFHALVVGAEVEVMEEETDEGGPSPKMRIGFSGFLPLMPVDVADVIRTGTTEEIRYFYSRRSQRPDLITKLLSPETLSFPRHCIYVLRDDIQAIIDSKQTPPAGSVPSREAVMRLSSQKARAANNDSRILAGILDHFKIDAGERGVVTLAAVLAHFGIDPGKRGQVKQIASWIDQRNPVSEDTVLDRLKKAKEILDKKSRTRPPA